MDKIDKIPINENITYHAAFIKLHTVTFIIEGQIVSIQNINHNGYANVNIVKIETNVTLVGWKVNNGLVKINEYLITQDTIFTAEITYVLDTWQNMTWYDSEGTEINLSGSRVFFIR